MPGRFDHDDDLDLIVVAVAEPEEGHGLNEQIFGADEQNPGRGQSD